MNKKVVAWISGITVLLVLVIYGLSGLNSTEEDNPPDESIEETELVENEDEDNEEQETINQNLEDWIPRLNNVSYIYEGSGNEFASFNWTPQFNEEDYYQIARDNSGTTVVQVYQYTEDKITRIHSQEETYYRDNLTSIWEMDSFEEDEIVLKAPIALGTSWSNDDIDYEITAIDAEIEVPAGNYQTIEVTIESGDTTIKKYYAEEIGLVYEKTDSAGLTIESKLAEIESDTAENIPLTIYQADDQLMGLETIESEILLETNEPARLEIERLLSGKIPEFENIFLLPEGTEINYLFLNEDHIVEVDLSEEYISNMNAGSSGEQFYLQGLTNTLTRYYGVNDLLLTIDGELYESGHILLKENELLSFSDEIVNN